MLDEERAKQAQVLPGVEGSTVHSAWKVPEQGSHATLSILSKVFQQLVTSAILCGFAASSIAARIRRQRQHSSSWWVSGFPIYEFPTAIDA